MRHRAIRLLALSVLSVSLLLSACDLQNLPIASPPTATSAPPAATSTLAPVPTGTAEPPTQPPATDTAVSALPTATAAAGATTTAGPTTAAGPTETPDPKLQAQLAQVEADTEQIRALKPKKTVPAHFITTTQLKKDMIDQINEDYSPEKGKRDAMALWLLRLINDPKIDLYQLQIDLLGEEVLGFYDQKKKELFVRSESGGFSPLERETLSHEFTHALQDQYFDLNKIKPDNIENDKGTAVLALIEGDAVVTMSLYDQQYMSAQDLDKLQQEKSSNPSTVLDRTPDYIKDSLYFPYEQGPTFITALARSQPGSYKGINDALKDPPLSSEQIMHPEKYLMAPRDDPKPVTIPPLTSTLGTGWTFQDTDSLGEFDLNEMLKINGVNNADSAGGWGGAQYAFYEKGDGGLVAADTVWDTADDAMRFDTDMVESLQPMKKQGSAWTDGKLFVEMKRSGSYVTFVSGTDLQAVEKVLALIKH